MMRRFMMAAVAAVGLTAEAGYTYVESVSLSGGHTTVYEVAAGDTVEIGSLGGGAGTLRKTGAGTLRINAVATAYPLVDVREGRLAFGASDEDFEAAEDVLADAWFHVDASDLASMTLVNENGTNFVLRWNDVRPSGTVFATPWEVTTETWRAPGARPFLRAEMQNGLPVVDFGSFANSGFIDGEGRGYGYGAAMDWSEGSSSLYEVFTVVSDTEDVKSAKTIAPGLTANATPFTGHSTEYRFLRGALVANKAPAIFANNANNWAQKYGTTVLDGQTVATPTAGNFPDGFHLLEFHHTGDATTVPRGNAFARDRTGTAGGQRLAEYVAFNAPLSDADRATLRRRLLGKWVAYRFAGLTVAEGATLETSHGAVVRVEALTFEGPASLTGDGSVTADRITQAGVVTSSAVTLGRAAGGAMPKVFATSSVGVSVQATGAVFTEGLSGAGGCLVKTGSGSLTVASSASGFTALDVREGTLRLAPLETRQTYLHVDADAASSLQTENVNGTNFVTRWNDFNANGHYAVSCATTSAFRPDPENRRPYVLSGALNGRAVVDFGSFLCASVAGYGAGMTWDARTTGIREVFAVSADDDGIAKLKTDQPTLNVNGTPFIGDEIYCNYLRGPLVADKNPLVVANNGNAQRVYDGTTTLDGVTINPKTTYYPNGFHVLDFRPTDGTIGNSFGTDRSAVFGGMKIAETLVFEKQADDNSRTDITRSLMVKWLGSGAVAHDYVSVNVATDSTLTLPAENLSIEESLSVDGCLEVGGGLMLADGAVLRISSRADVSARALMLAGTGTITVNARTSGASEKCYRIVAASSVSWNKGSWSAVDADGVSGKLKVKPDGLYADFTNPGLLLMVR